jgi:hypothetical protein
VHMVIKKALTFGKFEYNLFPFTGGVSKQYVTA